MTPALVAAISLAALALAVALLYLGRGFWAWLLPAALAAGTWAAAGDREARPSRRPIPTVRRHARGRSERLGWSRRVGMLVLPDRA